MKHFLIICIKAQQVMWTIVQWFIFHLIDYKHIKKYI